MSKKDYVLIASVIRDSVEGQKEGSHRVVSSANAVISNIAYYMAEKLKGDNIKFDSGRFLTACGVEQ
jgi:hypothetical protein